MNSRYAVCGRPAGSRKPMYFRTLMIARSFELVNPRSFRKSRLKTSGTPAFWILSRIFDVLPTDGMYGTFGSMEQCRLRFLTGRLDTVWQPRTEAQSPTEFN